MKTLSIYRRIRAITAIEVIMIIAALLMIAAVILPQVAKKHAKASRISCINNVKQVSLAFKIWSGDNGDRFPMQVSTNDGGSMEFVGIAAATFRHFEVASNELSSPKILFCPTDFGKTRTVATVFSSNVGGIPGAVPFNENSNLSYFAGVDASPTNFATLLVGDRNITNGLSIKNGLLELKTNQLVGWTAEMHNRWGNIGFADGSVQHVTSQGLRDLLKQTGAETTRLAMP